MAQMQHPPRTTIARFIPLLGGSALLLLAALSTGCGPAARPASSGKAEVPAVTSQATPQATPGCGTWLFTASNRLGANVNMVSGVSAASSKDIWVVGKSSPTISRDGASYQHPYVARWDGVAWTDIQLAIPAEQEVTLNAVVAVSPDDVWVVGSSTTRGSSASRTFTGHWDGTSLRPVDSPSPSANSNDLFSVAALGPRHVWATGYYGDMPLLMHWDGSAWQVDSSLDSTKPALGTGSLVDISATADGELWATGWRQKSECCPPDNEPLVVRRSGSNWEVVATPTFGGGIVPNSIGVISERDVWVVGTWGLTLHWDGEHWTDVVNPLTKTGYELNSVNVVASNDVWAVGGSDTGGEAPPAVLHWNGSNWTQLYLPKVAPAQLFYDVATTSTDVWAVGGTLSGVENGPWLPLVGRRPSAACTSREAANLR